MNRLVRALPVLAAGAIAAAAVAQPAPPSAPPRLLKYPEPRVRFQSEVKLQEGSARVEMKTWILAPALEAERLALPQDALIVIELHAGKLVTIIGDRRETRSIGAIWRVLPGEPMAFSTEDDSVTLTTLAIRLR